jgi:hypothetical protein
MSPPYQAIEHKFESRSGTLRSPPGAAHRLGGPRWGRSSAESGGQQRTVGISESGGQRRFAALGLGSETAGVGFHTAEATGPCETLLHHLKAGPAGGLRPPSGRLRRDGHPGRRPHPPAEEEPKQSGGCQVGQGWDREHSRQAVSSVLTGRVFDLCEYFRTASISTRLPFTDHRRPVPNAVVSRPVYHGHARRTRGGG